MTNDHKKKGMHQQIRTGLKLHTKDSTYNWLL